eukprot:130484_1
MRVKKKHGPLSDTDSLDAQHIHHVHHVQPRRLKDISNDGTPTGQFVRYESGQLAIPLKKNTFCRNLQNHAGANNIMMDDIIEEDESEHDDDDDDFLEMEILNENYN